MRNNRFIKYMITGIMLVVVSFMPIFQGFFGGIVYATDAGNLPFNTATGQTVDGIGEAASADFIKMLEIVNKGIYMLLWPSLAIGGAALGNDLVYGKAFFLDRSLRKFRQMMRTFSNFALGFIFIGSILMAFFKQNEDKSRIKKLFKRLVLAGILLNFSRWLVAAMIDLSTIGVVAIGGLPLTVMGSQKDGNVDEKRGDIRFLKSHSLIDLAPSNDQRQDDVSAAVVYSCVGTEDNYFLPCYVVNSSLAPEGDEEGEWGEYKKQSAKARDSFNKDAEKPININEGTIDDAYCVYGTDLIWNDYGTDIGKCEEYERLLKDGKEHQVALGCSVIGDLATKVSSSTGPLYTLYGSLFHMSSISMTTNFGDRTEVSFEMLMKAAVGIALLIPLLALAIVLVIRVVFLWLIIAFSPILVMAYAFEFKALETAQEGKFKIGTVVSLIFLPVFAVFALSISVVFLSVLQHITFFEVDEGAHPHAQEQESMCKNDPATIIGPVKNIKKEGHDKCYEFLGIQTVCFDEGDRVLGSNIVNVMSWLVMNFFGIALMWTILFFVLKSNAITKGVAGGIEKLAKQGMTALPIIPIGGGTSIGGVQQFMTNTKGKLNEYQQKQFDGSGLAGAMDHKGAQITGAANETIANIKQDAKSNFLNSSAKAANNTAAIDKAYDKAVPSVIKEVNRGIEDMNRNRPANEQIAKIDTSSVSTMDALIKSNSFQQYVDEMEGGKEFQKNFLKNRDQTSSISANAEMSQVWAEGLANAAINSGGYVFPTNEDGTPNHQGGENNMEYIRANGILKKFQWKKVPGQDNRWYIDKGSVETYRLPVTGLSGENEHDVTQFIRLVNHVGGMSNLPEGIKQKYYAAGGVLDEAIKADTSAHNRAAGVSETATLNLNPPNGPEVPVTYKFTGDSTNPKLTDISLR